MSSTSLHKGKTMRYPEFEPGTLGVLSWQCYQLSHEGRHFQIKSASSPNLKFKSSKKFENQIPEYFFQCCQLNISSIFSKLEPSFWKEFLECPCYRLFSKLHIKLVLNTAEQTVLHTNNGKKRQIKSDGSTFFKKPKNSQTLVHS
jgi:hypothetical protein